MKKNINPFLPSIMTTSEAKVTEESSATQVLEKGDGLL